VKLLFGGVAVILGVILASALRTDGAAAADLPRELRTLDTRVISPEYKKGTQLGRMLAQDVRVRIRAANKRENATWEKVASRDDWTHFRDSRIKALRSSLGIFPAVPKDLQVRVTRKLEGDGYRIENLVFESRPGVVVTANLYAPARASACWGTVAVP